MLRTENLQNEKIMSALEGLGLGGGELEAAEKYLKGRPERKSWQELHFGI